MKKCRENFKGIRQRFDAFEKLQTVNAVDREKFGKNFELFELLLNSILFSISTHTHMIVIWQILKTLRFSPL